jgi:hypothetical protein
MDARPVRLAELVGAMSLATDLANGFALEKTLRTTLVAVRLAAALDLDAATVRDVYYAAALRFIGCTGFAAEEAALADGDDIGFRHALLPADGTGDAVGRLWRDLGGGRGHRAAHDRPGHRRADDQARHRRAACDAALLLIAPIGLPDGVARALTEVFERPDGRGLPRGLRGDAIAIAARVVATADLAEQLTGVLGVDGTRRELTRRAGRQLDLAVVTAYLALPPAPPPDSTWDAFLAAEPGPPLVAPDAAGIDAVCTAVRAVRRRALAVDARPQRGGRGLAGRVARRSASTRRGARRSTAPACSTTWARSRMPLGTWERPGPLDAIERARVRRSRRDRRAPGRGRRAPDRGGAADRPPSRAPRRLGLSPRRPRRRAAVRRACSRWPTCGRRSRRSRAHRPRYDHVAAATLADAGARRPPRSRWRSRPRST